MTGEPEFTFRDTDERPVCSDCDGEMEHRRTRKTRMEEADVYACPDCETTFEDKWSF